MWTISADPPAAALCNGVTFPNVGETGWTSAPWSMRSHAVSGCAKNAAKWSAVASSGDRAATSGARRGTARA
jgi:hypothetical protein